MYEKEITEARHILNDATKDCATVELRAKHAEEETHKLQDKCIKQFIPLYKFKKDIFFT